MTQPVSMESLTSRKPAAGFDDPFGMMEACHQRLDRMLAVLVRLREHLARSGMDEQVRQAARDVMRYFDQAAPQHHRDEELHVFPPLIAYGDSDTVALIGRLLQEHAQMEADWRRAREVIVAIADAEKEVLTVEDEAALDLFTSVQAEHAKAEERIAYPAARAMLDPLAIQAMGNEMKGRRGVA